MDPKKQAELFYKSLATVDAASCKLLARGARIQRGRVAALKRKIKELELKQAPPTEIAALQGSGGELASGVYVTGSQEDVCAGTGNGFAGFSPGGVTALGLLFGRVHATVVAPSYSGGADVTFAIDLTWLGAGPVSRSHDVWDDGSAINVQWNASRGAITAGAVIANGVALDVDGALLARELSATITR